ncbi:MAG: transcriptional regulator [Deltaproteobacteria bacterium]|nr:MAG: transcriptional regulator [Deltaproteobacteria bacterium]
MSARPGVIRQALMVAQKDLLIEVRSPSRVVGLFFFALALVVLIAFTADASPGVLRKTAGGALWLGLLLASTRALDLSYAVETDNDALSGLVLWPVHPAAVFYGKAIANTAVLALVGTLLTPLVVALYSAPIPGGWPAWGQYAVILGLGSAALAAPGTFYALLTTRARASSVMLPLLMFPLVVPALLSASRATTLLMDGDGMGEVPGWVSLLLAFGLLHWSLEGLFYGSIVEDS